MPVTVGYHISHEQFAPSELLRLALRAQQAGFGALLSSDHFHPWTDAQGQSGLTWAWLGAALSCTSLPIGFVNAPGQRYHPAIAAQALATLGEMFPGRIWSALGSGQRLNEAITGEAWPTKSERNERLLECVRVMRQLLAGETVTQRGRVIVEEARLYTLPNQQPALFGAAVTPETAAWVGGWADGLLTISQPPEALRQVVEAFRRGGGAGKPMYLKVQLSYAPTQEEAMKGAREQWGGNVFPNAVLTELRSPAQFAALASLVQEHDLAQHVRISADLDRHLRWLRQDAALGFTHLFLHNVNRGQDAFIDAFGAHVVPALQER